MKYLRLTFVAIFATVSIQAAEPAATLNSAECIAFGERLAKLFNTHKAEDAIALLDSARFTARVADGLGLEPQDERDFKASLLANISSQFAQEFNAFASARFLRLQQVRGENRALIRLVSKNGAASYIAFTCSRDRTGTLGWSDAFLYVTGGTLSQEMRNIVLPLVAERKKGVLERLTTQENAFVTSLGKIHQATTALQRGDHASALAICEALPAEVRVTRMVLLLRARAAQNLDDAKYLKVLDDWANAFPNDPTLDFISIDSATLRKDYPAALRHIAAFSKQIGGDTYLDFLSGNVLMMSGRFSEARTIARRVLTQEPSLVAAFDTLISISLRTRNYAETVAVIEEFQQRFPTANIDRDVLATEQFADFRRSNAYQGWKERQKAAEKKKE